VSQLPSVSFLDSDPLLSFETEVGAAAESPEPVVEPRSSAARGELSAPSDELSSRVNVLEKNLAASTAEVALLRSDVATLVRAVDDIRTRNRKPGVAATAKAHRSQIGRAASIALVVVAAATGAWLWMFTGASAEPIVPPTQEQHATVPTDSAPASAATKGGDTSTPAPAAAPVAPPIERPPERPAPKPASQAAPKPVTQATQPSNQATQTPVNYVGTLSIDAAPGGEVFIDRRSAGRTPLRLTNLKAGSHLVWIERDGYSRWTRVVQVPSDRVTRVWADMEPLNPR